MQNESSLRIAPASYSRSASFFTLLEREFLQLKKIALQTVAAPVLMSALYLLVFGRVMQPGAENGVPYQNFLVPGLVMMTLLQNAFANSSSSLLHARIMGTIVYLQLPPLSGLQLACSFIGAAVLRGLICGAGVYAASLFFDVLIPEHPLLVLFSAVSGAVFMGSLGVICGLWADKFDQMGAFQTFFIMPLTFLSGVFYSASDLPEFWAKASLLNPFFHIMDGFRYGFFGTSDFSPAVSLAVLAGFSLAALSAAALLLMKGYKIRR